MYTQFTQFLVHHYFARHQAIINLMTLMTPVGIYFNCTLEYIQDSWKCMIYIAWKQEILKYSRKFSPWSSYPCGCWGASKCPCWWPLPLWIWCWWGTGLGLLWSEIEKRKLNRIRFLNSTSGCLEYKPSRGRERQYFRITLVDLTKKSSKNWVWLTSKVYWNLKPCD